MACGMHAGECEAAMNVCAHVVSVRWLYECVCECASSLSVLRSATIGPGFSTELAASWGRG